MSRLLLSLLQERSSGKGKPSASRQQDSAWALHLLRRQGAEIAGLVTTVNEAFDQQHRRVTRRAFRVAMHGVRRVLVEAQARAAGLPLWAVPLPWPCSNAEYETRMRALIARAVAEGIEEMAFGDLFLEDVRQYRERQLAGTGLRPVFPVWQIPTGRLALEMIAAGRPGAHAPGWRARIVCVNPRALEASFAGREFDAALLRDLPPGVDPCGENGEFHTFVYDAPVFRHPVPVESGPVCERDGFVFADLQLPQPGTGSPRRACAT